MHHLRAIEQLPKFVDGGLGEDERSRVAEHLVGCHQCNAWVAAYRHLSRTLGASAVHLSSDELSRFALVPETLDAEDRETCSLHLESCFECREETALASAAAAHAREKQVAWAATAERFSAASHSPLAWAAGLILVVGALMLGRAVVSLPTSRDLNGATMTGLTTVETRNSILVGAIRVESGVELTLKTGNMVAFRDGFSVDSGGTLSVIVDGSHDS